MSAPSRPTRDDQVAGPRKVGRPPVGSRDTRAAIIDAALELFAERGFDKTTTRAVAARAGVDVALIYHHFTGKDDLLVQALAAPESAQPSLQPVPADSPDPGRAVVAAFITLWDTDPVVRRRGVAMIRTALSHPHAAELLRQAQETAVGTLIQPVLADDHQAFRTGLITAQLSGLILSRHVVGATAIASADSAALIDAVAPSINHYLAGPLNRAIRRTVPDV